MQERGKDTWGRMMVCTFPSNPSPQRRTMPVWTRLLVTDKALGMLTSHKTYSDTVSAHDEAVTQGTQTAAPQSQPRPKYIVRPLGGTAQRGLFHRSRVLV
jgi:hypothetical protein